MVAPGFFAMLTTTDAARRRWSIASRVLAATFGGYALTSLLTLFLPLVLATVGLGQAQTLLAATTASFLVYAAIVLAVFHARSAAQAWVWLAGTAFPLGLAVWLLLPGARTLSH
jgi:hypothetical protein